MQANQKKQAKPLFLFRIDMGWQEFNEQANTASEAKALVKRKLGIKRLPVGVRAVKQGRLKEFGDGGTTDRPVDIHEEASAEVGADAGR